MARGLIRLAVALCSALLTGALAEVGHRAWLVTQGRAYHAEEAERLLQRNRNTMETFVPGATEARRPATLAGRVLHPFSGSELYPDTGSVLASLRQGFPDDAYVIVVVGGSVAAGWSADPGGVFVAALKTDPRLADRPIFLLRYAHAAYKQPQQLTRIAYLFNLGFRPDAIINLDGFNEVANGLNNGLAGIHPVYPTMATWGGIVGALTGGSLGHEEAVALAFELSALDRESEDLVQAALDWGLMRSSLVGTYVVGRFNRISRRRSRIEHELVGVVARGPQGSGRNFEIYGPDFDEDRAAIVEMSAGSWFQGSLSIDALCDVRGVYYLHCLQPTLHDGGSKTLTPAELALDPGPQAWKPGVELGYPRLRELGQELVAQGVHFVDTSLCLAGTSEAVYIDACHFNAAGNEAISRALAEAFLENLP